MNQGKQPDGCPFVLCHVVDEIALGEIDSVGAPRAVDVAVVESYAECSTGISRVSQETAVSDDYCVIE